MLKNGFEALLLASGTSEALSCRASCWKMGRTLVLGTAEPPTLIPKLYFSLRFGVPEPHNP